MTLGGEKPGFIDKLIHKVLYYFNFKWAQELSNIALKQAANDIAGIFLEHEAFAGRTKEEIRDVLFHYKGFRDRVVKFEDISAGEVKRLFRIAKRSHLVEGNGRQKRLYVDTTTVRDYDRKISQFVSDNRFKLIKNRSVASEYQKDSLIGFAKGKKEQFDIYISLAEKYESLGHSNDAYRFFKQASRLDPKAFFERYEAMQNDLNASKLEKAMALNNLGYCYRFGVGIKKNAEKAIHCFDDALTMSRRKHSMAWVYFGECYERGIGVEVDKKQAYRCFRKAKKVDSKNSIAWLKLGDCYRYQWGVDQNYERAFDYYSKAKELDPRNSMAWVKLGKFYYRGIGVKVDKKKATEYFSKALELDPENVQALGSLAFCYYYGDGFIQSYEQALHYYERAVELDPTRVKYWNQLGLCYDRGRKDFEKGYMCYKNAAIAKPRYTTALKNLGWCYKLGEGVKKDEDMEAFFFYLKGNLDDAVKAVPLFFMDIKKATAEELSEALTAYRKRLYGFELMGPKNIKKQVLPVLAKLIDLGKGTARDCIELADNLRESKPGKALKYYIISSSLIKDSKDPILKGIGKKVRFVEMCMSARQEEASAMIHYRLGMHYYNGDGIGRNYVKAYAAFKKAFEKKGNYNYAPILQAIGLGIEAVQALNKGIDDISLRVKNARENFGEGKLFAPFQFYAKARIKQMQRRLGGDQGLYIDFSKLLHDPETKKWNVLKQRNGVIKDQAWSDLKVQLESLTDYLYPGQEGIKKGVTGFFNKSMLTKEAKKSEAGKLFMRKRVASVIDYAVGLAHSKQAEALKRAKVLVAIMNDGGGACPDRVAVMLEKAESYIKIYTSNEGGNKNYLINVLVNLFKRNAIDARLVNHEKGEALEQSLYHLLLLDKFLGLGVLSREMLYEEFVKKTNMNKELDLALKKVYKDFTANALIGYVSGHEAFQELYKKEKEAMKVQHEKEQAAFNDAFANLRDKYEDEDLEIPEGKMEAYNKEFKAFEAKRNTVIAEQEKLEREFFENKAKDLLKEAGFVTNRLDYGDPPEGVFTP